MPSRASMKRVAELLEKRPHHENPCSFKVFGSSSRSSATDAPIAPRRGLDQRLERSAAPVASHALCPPPGQRTRPGSLGGVSPPSSRRPRPMVRATPVISSLIPPRPKLRASLVTSGLVKIRRQCLVSIPVHSQYIEDKPTLRIPFNHPRRNHPRNHPRNHA